MSSLSLLKHQRVGIDWLSERPYALLADQMGLGKSAQALLSAREPVLVMAPAQVLDAGVWDDEVEKWAPGMDVTQVAYTSLTTRERTSRGGSRPTTILKPEIKERKWGRVIADESHHLKGRKTHWTVALLKLRMEALTLMTGSPIPNWAHEAYISLKLMNPGDKRFSSYWRWVGEWFHVGPTIFSPMAVGEFRDEEHMRGCRDCLGKPPRTWEEFDRENFGDLLLRRLRDDVLELPPISFEEQRIPMDPEQQRVYEGLRRDFVSWLPSGREVSTWSTAGQMTRLLQGATGLEALGERGAQTGKFAQLASNLDTRTRPTLVVGHFRNTVSAAADTARGIGCETAVIDGGVRPAARKRIVKAFQNGEVDVLCATLDTVAEGMTFTAADRLERVERSWKPYTNEQVTFRLHRIGQELPVTVNDLISEGTVDEDVMELVSAKTDQQMGALQPAELRSLAL